MTKFPKYFVFNVIMEIGSKIICLNNQKNDEELTNVVENTSVRELIDAAISRLERSDGTFISYWDAVLIATDSFSENDDKRYKIVLAVLEHLNKVVITHKETYDIISRLFIDLPKFSPAQLIEFAEYCTDSMRCGDSKCVGWKDLFPPVLRLLSDRKELIVNGIVSTGSQYRQQCIQNVTTMKWPLSVLTPIAMMFKEMPITKEERTKIMEKFSESLQELEPTDLPALANQLFLLTTNMSLLLMVLFSFQKYFHKFYYKKLFIDMETDSMTESDSIDPYPHCEKELREAEETILYYLSKSTQYCITEEQVVASCRALSPAPKYILTPFMLSSLLSLCNGNRDPSSTTVLANSPILSFIRNVIKNNEIEKRMCKESAWCRDTLDRFTIDLNKIFMVLIHQSKEGRDSVTPGIVTLAFVLLKTKDNPELNAIGINFLEQFVKKRFVFGSGIVKEIVNLMLVNQDCDQYIECLTRLSLTSTLTVSECTGSINHIMENMLLIPGQSAIDMMIAISPLLKASDKIRDMFIEVLRKAIYDRNVSTQQMGVHGFCLVLKSIRENSRRIRSGSNTFSQASISGFSLASQIIQSNRAHKQRHFDMLALEILGILKKCFNHTSLIKVTLYDGLSKAIEFNPKIIPHLVSFLTQHFQQFFEMSDLSFEIKFNKIVRERSENVYDIWDNLGQLVWSMSRIVVLAKKNELHCEIDSTAQTLETIMKKIDVVTVEQLGLIDRLDERTSHIGTQYLNTLEALMGFALHAASKENTFLIKILKLYKHHSTILEQLTAANVPKKVKKSRNADSSANTSKPVPFQPENIWDLPTLERFLHLIYEDDVAFATSNQTNALRINNEFIRFILRTASTKVAQLHREPQYRQLTHSKSAFTNLCHMSRLVFGVIRSDVSSLDLVLELFYNCLLAGDVLFRRKLDEFLRAIINQESESLSQSIKRVTQVIQELVEQLILNNDEDNTDTRTIASSFLQCLELLYNHFEENDSNSLSAFKWLHKICSNYDIGNKNMNQIHKLLFNLRMQNDFGSYFDSISLQISQILEQHEEVTLNCQFELKSMTVDIIETTITHLCSSLRRQIEFVEYFITKAKSLHAKLKITGLSTAGKCVQTLKSTERKICSQLIHICNAATHLANSCIPLGNSMDQVKRLLIQLYVCLTNMTKYLLMRHSLQPVSCQSVLFDQLVRAGGRSLAHKAYCMITYVEQKQKPDKVIRETKFLPKLVLRIETFNKYVICLGKKTKCDLSNHLHIGRVRYFRIQRLQDVLDQTIQDCSEIQIDESNLDEQEREDESVSGSESNAEDNVISSPSTISTATSESIEDNEVGLTKTKLLRNMQKINKKATKKRAQKTDDDEKGMPSKRKKLKK